MGEPALPASPLPERPQLKPWYRVSLEADRTVLRYGGSVLEFGGADAVRLLPRLLRLLDGTRTLEEIAATFGEPVRPAVAEAVRLLARQRLLVDPAGGELPADTARTVGFLAATDRYDRGPAAALRGLERASAAVVGSGAVAAAIAALLRRSGVPSVARAGWRDPAAHESRLAVVAPAPDETGRVEEWNRDALARGSEWLQVLPYDGLVAAVGPVVVPGESACHECYRLRRAANVSPLADRGGGAAASAPVLDSVVAGLAALVAVRRLACEDGLAVGTVLAVEASPEPACSRHVVYRVPRCPACSPAAAAAAPSPWHAEEARAA
ncbi:MAG TPA: TOMM precursor leader peptide-binding protein [Gaiellaceae bacterium]|nr:TOMM precursor leader peptide-binding protein [Gaiellaceae bacterium]